MSALVDVSKYPQPVKFPGTETVTVVGGANVVEVVVGVDDAGVAARSSEPVTRAPTSAVALLEAEIKCQRGEREHQCHRNGNSVKVLLNHRRTLRHGSQGSTRKVRDSATATGVHENEKNQRDGANDLHNDD